MPASCPSTGEDQCSFSPSSDNSNSIPASGGPALLALRISGRFGSPAEIEAALQRFESARSKPSALAYAAIAEGIAEGKGGPAAALRFLRAAPGLDFRDPADAAALRDIVRYSHAAGERATPPEYRGRGAVYIADVAIPGLEAAHAEGLVDAVDGFCETIAFSADELAPLFERARALGLPVKLHAEQLSNSGGAAFAAGYGALSCDHIEYLDAAGVAAMRGAGSTAVLLPGAFYALRETKVPPVAALRDAGVPIALATDLNPGTSPLASLLLTMNLAATFFRLTVPECLAGTTREAARALGLAAETGTLEAGKSADFTVWQVTSPAELVYWIGLVPAHTRVFRGAPSC